MHIDSTVLIIMFIVFALLFGALIKSFHKVLTSPYSVVLLLAGLSLGLYSRTNHMQEHLPALNNMLGELALIDPHLILLLFLPTLIFESAFAMETHLFKRMFSQIAILAVPGLILTTALTASFAYYFFPWQWSWTVCFLFGALISATDPVAVVSLLKEVSSRKRLETLIEGESLLNDGTAIVLFTLFYGILSATGEINISAVSITSSFLSVVLFGFLTGLCVATIIIFWIGRLFNQPTIEITLTISGAYIAYFIAENIFHVSGVVAVVTLALLLASVGRTKISPEVSSFLHHFWQMMAHIANTLIFILVGLIIASRIRLDVIEWWLTLAALYICIQLIRATSVVIFMPLLKRIGIGLTKTKALVLVWGGLRGAVSLALALIIAQDTILSKETGDQILFLTAGIVVLTIIINSSTMTQLLKILGLDKLPPSKQASLDKAQFMIKQNLLKELPALQKNEFLQRADWVNLSKPLQALKAPSDFTEQDRGFAFKRRLLETERQFYWSQFKKGTLTGTATKQLVNAVEIALDGEPQISPRNTLFEFWKTPRYLQFFNKIPCLNRVILHFSFDRLALSYDSARGFIEAQQEIEKYCLDLAPSQQDAEQVLEQIKQNKKETRYHIQEIRDNFPELSYSLETHSAEKLLLHLERVHLNKLISEGMLDDSEASKLGQQIDHKLTHLQQRPHFLSSVEISKQLALMSWASDLKAKSLSRLGKLAKRQIYSDGELIFRQNGRARSVALIVHGKVELINISGEQIVNRGQFIDLSIFLTSRYKKSAKAVTPVELIWFDIDKLKKIIAKDSHLALLFATLIEQEAHD